jgi:methionine biosynthesis protein MetW
MTMLELVHAAPPEALEAAREPLRADQRTIAILTEQGAKALVVGCGDGQLIEHLARSKSAKARGLEHNRVMAHACVARGLSVLQCDPEEDLAAFQADVFDVVIFPRTLEHMRRPSAALREARRISEHVIVSIANAGHWRQRARLMFDGRMPAAEGGSAQRWSILDFAALASAARLKIERASPISNGQAGAPFAKVFWRANWFAEEAVFLLSR